MRLNSLKKSLLVIALVLSQWLVVGHTLQHSALAQDQVCQICLHAQGLDSGAAPLALPTLVLPQQEECPAIALSTPVLRVVISTHPIRGPPLLVG